MEKLFSLPGNEDRVPITVQLLEVYQKPTRNEVMLSDGMHFCVVTLAKCLQPLIVTSELQWGTILTLRNYITQPIDNGNLAAICLDAFVVGFLESIIGYPSEFVPVSLSFNFTNDFVTNANVKDDFCNICNEESCDWNAYGQAIVQAVRSAHGNPCDRSTSSNKACRFNAYNMYARLKFGYLGKGNRKALPVREVLLALLPIPCKKIHSLSSEPFSAFFS
jgi:hypothetical protein